MVRDMDGGQDMFRLLEQSDLIVMNKCDTTWYLAWGDQSGEHTHTHTHSHTLTHTHTLRLRLRNRYYSLFSP